MSFDPFGQDPQSRPPEPPANRGRLPDPGLGAGDPDRDAEAVKAAAREKALLPGILLIAVGLLNLVAGLGAIGIGLAVMGVPPEQLEKQLAQHPQQAQNLEQMKKAGYKIEDILKIYTFGGVGGGAAVSFFALIAILGGVCLLMLRGYGLAVLSAVLTAIPCLSPMACPCLVGMVVGLYAVVVLLGEETRAGFR